MRIDGHRRSGGHGWVSGGGGCLSGFLSDVLSEDAEFFSDFFSHSGVGEVSHDFFACVEGFFPLPA